MIRYPRDIEPVWMGEPCALRAWRMGELTFMRNALGACEGGQPSVEVLGTVDGVGELQVLRVGLCRVAPAVQGTALLLAVVEPSPPDAADPRLYCPAACAAEVAAVRNMVDEYNECVLSEAYLAAHEENSDLKVTAQCSSVIFDDLSGPLTALAMPVKADNI